MALQTFGQPTTHFTVRYDDVAGAPALAVAKVVHDLCEVDLARLNALLPLPHPIGGPGDPFLNPTIDIQIINDPLNGPGPGGGRNHGYSAGHQSNIQINPFYPNGTQISDDFAGFVFIAEMAELIMGFYSWDAGSSQGEALSIVMAEELHPASSTNQVNDWLNTNQVNYRLKLKAPRPDWISHNAPYDGGIAGRGDQNRVAYGCGMIFIYFLRYQLNIPYSEISRSGGAPHSTDYFLSGRYHYLTGLNDDPADRVNKLLDAHFGTGAINLVGNNPFPLYEGTAREVFLALAKPAFHEFLLPQNGTAHVRPFFNCPAADYPYSVYGRNVTETITATTLGIGLPMFQWRVNGKLLSGRNITLWDTVKAEVDVPDPQHPDDPSHQTQTFSFNYQIHNAFTAAGGSSTLKIASSSLDGAYHVEVQVDADETAVPTGAVTVKQGLTLTTRAVRYGGSYGDDQERCESAFLHSTAGLVRIHENLNLLRTLPDPPPPDYLTKVLEAAAHIRKELTHIAATDHATATQVAHYAAGQLGVPAHVFLRGARAAE